MIKLLDLILDKMDGLEINIHKKNIKVVCERKASFYEENPHERERRAFLRKAQAIG